MAKPVIQSDFGPVTEVARRQAAANMAARPDLKALIEEKLGRDLAIQRYPEGYSRWERAGAWWRRMRAK